MELHSGLVHFPIALMVIGAIFEVLGRILKRNALSSSAHYVIVSAALIGLATAGSGLLAASQVQNPEVRETLGLHRLLGLGVVGIAIVLSGLRLSARNVFGGVVATTYLVLLLGGAGLAVGTGWLGGKISHGGHSHDEHSAIAAPTESMPAPNVVAPPENTNGGNTAHEQGHHDDHHPSDDQHHEH
ncbi:MAG: DUF2231 domain-containing protein [Armatimonadetes bacterium]|nr:DUF2231 domain-containing protein [Armatimonadota bacterium]